MDALQALLFRLRQEGRLRDAERRLEALIAALSARQVRSRR